LQEFSRADAIPPQGLPAGCVQTIEIARLAGEFR